MTFKQFSILVSLLSLFTLSGCVSVIDAVSEEPIKPDPTKRSFGEYWDDKQLETIVAVNLKKASPSLKDLNIRVHSFNSVILLTGEVPTKELRELAGATARDLSRVRQVYNELDIAPQRGFWDNTHDKYLGSKIKSKLFVYKDIKSNRVKVFVEDRKVYLMGLLSRAQAEKITDVIRRQKGVRKVVRAIEYID